MADWDLIVVGGGPAGMMAAGRAGERARKVLLLERGPSLGRKLLLTAGGRCNVTNSASPEEFVAAFGRRGGFLRDPLARFGSAQMIEWLHARGVETIEERKGRVFPKTQSAATVLRALTDFMAAGNVHVRLNTRVESLFIEQAAVAGVRVAGRDERAAAVLIATGGLSYPATGSTGDGYALARQAGHTIEPTYPAIIALETEETWPKRIQGTPIKNVAIRALRDGKKLAETFGEALWTHYGISGPAIFDISDDVAPALRRGANVTLELDFRPGDTEESLDERLVFAIKREGKKQVDHVIADWVAQRAATVLAEIAGVEPKTKMNQCSKSDRRKIVRTIKRLELHVARTRPIEEAIVTGGGVACAEVESKTMQSKLLRGLYFAGETLDLAGPTGGYNLQAAFSTGWLVGEDV